MKPASLAWMASMSVSASLSIAACTAPAGSQPAATSRPDSGTSVADTAREKASDALAAAASVVKPKRQIELPAGTVVAVRTTRALSTVRDRAQDTFDAILDEPIVVDDVEVLPRGTKFTGHVTTSEQSGRMEGRAVLGITLDGVDVRGAQQSIATSVNTKASEGHKKRNIVAAGGGAGVGALIGGIAGGGKGAAIGAAVGAGAGTGAAAATGKQDVEIPAETRFRFTLKHAVVLAG